MISDRNPLSDDAILYPDELPGEPITGELPPISMEDIRRTAERLEAGRASNTYRLGPSDLHVLMRLTQAQWQVASRTPAALVQILTPTVHA